MSDFVWKPLDPEDIDVHEDPNAVVTPHLGIKKSILIEDNVEDELVTDGELYNKVAEIINLIRPFVKQDGGDVHLVGIKNGWVHIKFEGSCTTCSISSGTVLEIEQSICEELPEVKGVEIVQD